MLLPRRDGEGERGPMLERPHKPLYRTNSPGDMATVAMEHVNRCGEPWPGLSNPELDWAIAHSNGDDTDTIWAHYRALFQGRTEPLPADFLEFVADLNS